MDFFKKYFDRISVSVSKIDKNKIVQLVKLVDNVKNLKSKIIIAGNGGSAAIASHIAVDLTKAAGIRAITFNEPDLITCFANDYGYEKWVEKGIDFYAEKNDVIILISSSGKSKNIINAGLKAKKLGLKLITLSGFNKNNPLRKIGDINLWADSKEYNVVEMTHQIWLVSIIDKIIEDNRTVTNN